MLSPTGTLSLQELYNQSPGYLDNVFLSQVCLTTSLIYSPWSDDTGGAFTKLGRFVHCPIPVRPCGLLRRQLRASPCHAEYGWGLRGRFRLYRSIGCGGGGYRKLETFLCFLYFLLKKLLSSLCCPRKTINFDVFSTTVHILESTVAAHSGVLPRFHLHLWRNHPWVLGVHFGRSGSRF